MNVIYGLTPREAQALTIPAYVRYVMDYLDDGEWDSARVIDVLERRGWDTEASYPRNLAGNVLTRLMHKGALIPVARGRYLPVMEVVQEMQRKYVQRNRNTLPGSLCRKLVAAQFSEQPAEETN